MTTQEKNTFFSALDSEALSFYSYMRQSLVARFDDYIFNILKEKNFDLNVDSVNKMDLHSILKSFEMKFIVK